MDEDETEATAVSSAARLSSADGAENAPPDGADGASAEDADDGAAGDDSASVVFLSRLRLKIGLTYQRYPPTGANSGYRAERRETGTVRSRAAEDRLELIADDHLASHSNPQVPLGTPVVPPKGFEPSTYRLGGGRSSPELRGRAGQSTRCSADCPISRTRRCAKPAGQQTGSRTGD